MNPAEPAPPQNVAIFCLTHVPLLVPYPAHVKVVRMGSYQADGELNLRDLAPEWEVFHPLLGATAGTFAVRNYLKAHPEYTHVASCSYRKFLSARQIGEPLRNFPQQHAISVAQLAEQDLDGLLDYSGRDFLISHPLDFHPWGMSNIAHQYQKDHHIEDLLRFLAEAVEEKMLTPFDAYALMNEHILIPGGAELGLYPVPFFLNAIDRIERIVAAYLRRFRVIRDGYQLRAISFCCERVGSYLLLQYLNARFPGGIPASYYGHINLVSR